MSRHVSRAMLCGIVALGFVLLGTVRPAGIASAAQGPSGPLSVMIATDAAGHAITCTAFSTADPTKLAVGQSECKIDLTGSPTGWTPGQVVFALYLQCTMTGDSGTCALDPAMGGNSIAAFAWNPGGAGVNANAAVVNGFNSIKGTLVNTANGPQLNLTGTATLNQSYFDNTFNSKSVSFTLSSLTDNSGHTTVNFNPGPLCTSASCAATFSPTPWILSCTGCFFEAGAPWGITSSGNPTGTTGGTGTGTGTGTTGTGTGTTPFGPTPFVLAGITHSGLGVSPWFRVYFTSSAPGHGEVLFGSGPGCLGLIGTATMDQTPGTTQHTVLVQGDELHPGTGLVPGATYSFETVTVTATGTTVDNNGGKCYTVTVPKS